MRTKKGQRFAFGLIVVALAMFLTFIGLSGKNRDITGYAVKEGVSQPYDSIVQFAYLNDAAVLSPGNYFIDVEGVVYLIDNNSRIAVAKIQNIKDTQKNRNIYIDRNGNIGYLIN